MAVSRLQTSREGSECWRKWREGRRAPNLGVANFAVGVNVVSDSSKASADVAAEPLSRSELAAAVRHTLSLLERKAPGRSVEVRVVPFGAIQVVEGTTHRRGTPPAVVEMDAETWLSVASGITSWQDAESVGDIDASGERTDLSSYLPLNEDERG